MNTFSCTSDQIVWVISSELLGDVQGSCSCFSEESKKTCRLANRQPLGEEKLNCTDKTHCLCREMSTQQTTQWYSSICAGSWQLFTVLSFPLLLLQTSIQCYIQYVTVLLFLPKYDCVFFSVPLTPCCQGKNTDLTPQSFRTEIRQRFCDFTVFRFNYVAFSISSWILLVPRNIADDL